MSVPDYSQRAEDHGSILILVKHIGHQLKQKSFNMIYDRISRQEYIRVHESQMGRQRGIWLRYKKSYSIENNDWGDFQAHRKVLGLICIGQCCSQSELDQLSQYHETLRQKYSNTLFDSRCAIFGFSMPSNEKKNNNAEQQPVSTPVSKNIINLPSSSPPMKKLEKLDPKDLEKLFPQPLDVMPKSSSMQFTDNCEDAKVNEDDVAKNFENNKLIEMSDNSVVDGSTETRQNVENSTYSSPDRINADSGVQPIESRKSQFLFYNSIEQDFNRLEQDLYEFACSLFWVLESKRLDSRMYDKSTTEKVQLPIICAPLENKDILFNDGDIRSQKKKILGRLKKHMGDLSLQSSLPSEALVHYTAAVGLLESTNDFLWLAAAYEGLCSASVILLYPTLHYRRVSFTRNISLHAGSPPPPNKMRHGISNAQNLSNGMDLNDPKSQQCLTSDGIIEKYEDAIRFYSKFKIAAVIETECSVKAVRVLVIQEKCLKATNFLQNMIFISLQLSEEEKIERFSALSDLYKQIGFHRKAAFFKRIAAMRCVAPQNEAPNWSRCYNLLLQTLEGYRLSLDPREFPKDMINGWPGLQIQILQELVGTAKKMGNSPLAVRHMTFLLHAMFDHISKSDRIEFSKQLETLTSKCEGAPVILALEDTGRIIPPVNLISLPCVKSFKLQNMAPNLRPLKISSEPNEVKSSINHGPFIFSPLSLNRDKPVKDLTKIDFCWVEGDVCEVSLRVFNPLPFELKVTHMGLMADGIAFETFPSCLSLPPESGPFPVNLLGTPRSTGELIILGYTTHVLGVKSNCKLIDLPAIKEPTYSIEVVPALPQVQVTTSLPKSATFSSLADTASHVVTSASISLYAGQTQECTITLTCIGSYNVEKVYFSLQSKPDVREKFFVWNAEDIISRLPIIPDHSASCVLEVHAVSDFVCHHAIKVDNSNRSRSGSLKNTPTHSQTSKDNETSSQKHPHSEVLGSCSQALQMQIVEALMNIQYAGGPGMLQDYSRQCAVAINVEVIPSMVITKWDVLPAETASHCYLVLDILNTTSHEMEVQYTDDKRMLIEAHETCRVPVPIERCPLAKLSVDNSCSKSSSPQEICRQYVSDLVNLKWSLPSVDINGVASISNITWTPKMLDVICMSPICWELSLNDEAYKMQNENTFQLGELITIGVAIVNQSDKPLQSLLLTIQGYQDHQNGNCDYRLDHKRAVIGSDKVVIDQIPLGERYRHSVGMLFFCPGTYKLDIQCCNRPQDSSVTSTTAPSVVSFVNNANLGHVWKCSPSIELTVEED
ncbi:TRAPPC9 (predicted) [Pycnogonum litorale]